MTELERQIVKACGEIDRLRDINSELVKALEMVRGTVMDHGDSFEWAVLNGAIKAAMESK